MKKAVFAFTAVLFLFCSCNETVFRRVVFNPGAVAQNGEISVEGRMNPQTVEEGVPAELSKNQYKADGFRFIGWAEILANAVCISIGYPMIVEGGVRVLRVPI